MEKIALYGKFSENMLNALKAKCPEGFETYLVKPDDDLALLADAEHKKRAAAPQKKRYDFDF